MRHCTPRRAQCQLRATLRGVRLRQGKPRRSGVPVPPLNRRPAVGAAQAVGRQGEGASKALPRHYARPRPKLRPALSREPEFSTRPLEKFQKLERAPGAERGAQALGRPAPSAPNVASCEGLSDACRGWNFASSHNRTLKSLPPLGHRLVVPRAKFTV